MRHAEQVVVMSRRAARRSTATACTDQPAPHGAGRSRRSGPARRSAWSTASASAPRRRAHRRGGGGRPPQRRHRRRLGDRQDGARPPDGRPDGRGLPGLRVRPPRRLRDARAPRRPADRGGSRRSTGAPSSSAAYPHAPERRRPATGHDSPTAPGRWRTRARNRLEAHREEVEPDRAPRELGARGQEGLRRPADALPLGGRDRLGERGPVTACLDLADGHARRRAPPPGRARRLPRAWRAARIVQPRRRRCRAAAASPRRPSRWSRPMPGSCAARS